MRGSGEAGGPLVIMGFFGCYGVTGRVNGGGLTPVAADFDYSLQNTAVSIGVPAVQVIRKNCLPRLKFTLGRGCSLMSTFVVNDLVGLTPTDITLAVNVDGASFADLTPTIVNSMQVFEVAMDGLPHTVEIFEPYQQYDTVTVGNILGAFIYKVQCYGGVPTIVAPDTTVAHQVAFGGDSISAGAFATLPARGGMIPLLRAANPTKRVSFQGWGGNSLWDNSGTGSGQNGFASPALYAARLDGLLGTAVLQRLIVDFLGQNDWAPGFHRWSSASFGTACAAHYDAVHAANPLDSVLAVSPIVVGNEAATNTFGETIGQYRAAKLAAATGRAWVTYVDGLTLMSPANLSPDGIHPNNAGQAQIAGNLQALIP